MNLTQGARAQGVRPQTAYRWFREGTSPVAAVRSNSRSLLVAPDAATCAPMVSLDLYASVSCHDQRGELDRRVARLFEWAKDRPAGGRIEAEVASGMNGSRAKLADTQ